MGSEEVGSVTLGQYLRQLAHHRNFLWFVGMDLVQVFHCHFNSNFFPLFLEHLLSDHISLSTGSFLLGEWVPWAGWKDGGLHPRTPSPAAGTATSPAGARGAEQNLLWGCTSSPQLFSVGRGRTGAGCHGGPFGAGATQRRHGTVAGLQGGLQSDRPGCAS